MTIGTCQILTGEEDHPVITKFGSLPWILISGDRSPWIMVTPKYLIELRKEIDAYLISLEPDEIHIPSDVAAPLEVESGS